MVYKWVFYSSNLFNLLHYIISIYLSNWNFKMQTVGLFAQNCFILQVSVRWRHQALPSCWGSEVIQKFPVRMSCDMNVALVGQIGRSQTVHLSEVRGHRPAVITVAGLWLRLLSEFSRILSGAGGGGGKVALAVALECGFGTTECICTLLYLDLDLKCELNNSSWHWGGGARVDTALWLVGPTLATFPQ